MPRPPMSLYNICLRRTSGLLQDGFWKKYPENQFCGLPSHIIDELMSVVLSLNSPLRTRVADICPLLTSGRLKNLDLFHAGREAVEKDYSKLLRMLSDSSHNLRSLKLNYKWCLPDDSVANELLKLLNVSPNLEELHTSLFFNLNELKHGKRLRSLKLHLGMNEVKDFFNHGTPDFLLCLKSLKEFSICLGPADYVDAYKAIAMILKYCPNIISVGCVDSSMAIEYLLDSEKRVGAVSPTYQFQLRKCFWGKSKCLWMHVDREADCLFRNRFSKRIADAVYSCPLVEQLLIDVYHKDCIAHLKHLKNLSLLEINFRPCYGDGFPEFYSLLNEIGPQLKHLSVFGRGLHVDAIINCCPNLESLRIARGTVNDPTEFTVNLSHLKCLSLFQCDWKSMLFLLSSCEHLKELYLEYATGLNDNLLHTILRRNSFSKLELACIGFCDLSESGLRKFLQTAMMLKKFSFSATSFFGDNVKHVVSEMNSSIEFWGERYPLQQNQFFEKKTNYCCF